MPGWDILNGDIQTFFPLRFKQLGAPLNTTAMACDAFERLDCREKGGSEKHGSTNLHYPSVRS